MDGRRPPCDQLPALSAVQRILDENASTVSKLKDPDRGVFLSVINDANRCPGKAYLHITYDTLTTRRDIKRLLGETFFGVPYTMQNI